VVAFHTKTGFVCESVIRSGAGFNICSDVPQVPDPLLVPYSFVKFGPKPTTFIVVAAAEEVARVRVRLAPGGRVVSRRMRELDTHESRRSGLPEGFRFGVIAVPKARGIHSTSGFSSDGALVGRLRGSGAPS